MMRRFILAVVLVVSSAAVVLAFPATLMLKGGQRVSGDLTYRVGGNDVTIDGRDYSLDDVAVISYVTTDPAAAEVNSVPTMDGNPSELERHVFVTRDGQTIFGKLYKFSPDGRTVTFDPRGGGRRDIQADQLARIYINPGSARRLYAPIIARNQAPTVPVPTPPVQTSGTTIRVPGNQQWVPTNINVQAGDTIRFDSRGEVRYSRNSADRATPAGAVNGSLSEAGPVPRAPLGALIGRVGSGTGFNRGRTFLIGSQGAVKMPTGGPLFLGINDDGVGDNTGDFVVTISR
jgi:hypothetical protein